VSLQSGVFRFLARGCHLRHTARTLHGEINIRVIRGADNCHVPRQGLAAFKSNQRQTIRSLAILAYQAKPTGALTTGTPAATKARATRSFNMWCLGDLLGASVQTRLCRPRASTGEPHRQRWGTHKSNPSRKPTATLTASSSSFAAAGCNRQRKQPVSTMTGGSNQKGSQLKRTIKAGLNLGAVRCNDRAIPECLFGRKMIRRCAKPGRPNRPIRQICL